MTGTPASSVRAPHRGEALSAVLLVAAAERLVASPMSEVGEVLATRRLPREPVGALGIPAVVIRVGLPR
jgi:hypothetical protein